MAGKDENVTNRLLRLFTIAPAILVLAHASTLSAQGQTESSPDAAVQTEGAVYKSGDNKAIMSARFDASPADVFDAMTSPDSIRQWLSAGPLELIECEIDLRPGGAFRYVFRGAEGAAFVMYGRYTDVERPSRIVHLESYEGSDWEPLIVATEFADDGAGTALTITVKYPSQEIRDQDFPNLQHAVSTYARLAEFLARRPS